jgi:hypothetical protein
MGPQASNEFVVIQPMLFHRNRRLVRASAVGADIFAMTAIFYFSRR